MVRRIVKTESLERLRLPRGQVWREGPLRQVTVHQFYGDVWKVLQEATNFSFSMVRSEEDSPQF